MVGHELNRHVGAPSPAHSDDLQSQSAHDSTFNQQHSFPQDSNAHHPLSSPNQTNNSNGHTSNRQYDEATFEQTQRAVGNLLDALRTNHGQSNTVEKTTTTTTTAGPFAELSGKILATSDIQRPTISPLEPQSPNVSAPTPTGFTFPGGQALDESLGINPTNELIANMANISGPAEDLTMVAFDQSQSLEHPGTTEEDVMDTIEEELPANVQNAQDTGQISAYAKLEFDDGPFYITTYSLELGRDARAYKAAKARLAEQQALQKGEGSSSGNSHPSGQSKREGGSQVKGSVVSDRGGFYGVDDIEGEAQEADEERQRQQADHSQSSIHSASSIVNPKDLHTQPPLPHFNYQAYPIEEYERDIEEIPAPVTSEHFPEQEEGFLLPIHHAPVKDGIEQDVANHRSVSRRHAKIFWEDDCFKFHVKGVNGAFVNEVHYPMGSIIPLRSDVSIQIKGIKFQFKLPVHSSIESSEESDPVADDSPNQKEETSSATSGLERTVSPHKTPIKVKIKNFKRTSPPPLQPILGPDGKPKRRGPGRPPKDGIMSKRERTAKERADREAAAKAANGGVTPEPPNKGKSGRTTTKNATEAEEPKPAKRKYTKRKSVNQDGDDVTPKLEEDSDAPVDDAPPPKRARVARSESPEYPKYEDLKEKDLERPPWNYSILIYDLLKDSPKPLDLKGIYRGLKMKWPHFLYRYKDAKGWESSVRHNVNEDKLGIIEKVDRVGKGYSYRAKPGVDIEQHKKKRARSPPAVQKMSAPPQQRFQQQPHSRNPGLYAYPQGHPPPRSHHGMYGHLVPTTVPQGSMSSATSYAPATAGPYSSGAMPNPPQHATSGQPPQHIPYPMATNSSSAPTTATAGPYPPQPAAYPAPPGPSNVPQQHPHNPPNATAYPPNQQPPPQHAVPYQPQPSQIQQPPPPLGVSPFDPFLPTGLSVISTFESSLLEGVENPADLPRIRATLDSVRKRVFEGASSSSLVGGETQDERTFLHYFRHILENERFRNPGFVGWEAVRAERERRSRSGGMIQSAPVYGGQAPVLGLRGGSGEPEEGEKEEGQEGNEEEKGPEEEKGREGKEGDCQLEAKAKDDDRGGGGGFNEGAETREDQENARVRQCEADPEPMHGAESTKNGNEEDEKPQEKEERI